MKRLKILYSAIFAVIGACTLLLTTGCDRLHEDFGPCPRGIKLKLYYDYNMKFADALPAEVRSVEVYIFDPKTGEAVDRIEKQVGDVREHEFEINLDHLPPARYDFLVWCYGESSEYFTVNPTRQFPELRRYHSCLISEDPGKPGHQSKDIGRLYYGSLIDVDCTDDSASYIFEIPLIKNTNVVRLVLQHLNGEYLDPSKFDICMESDNGHMNYDNSLISGNTRTYHPWAVASGTTGMKPYLGEDTRAITSASALVAEHTIGRIIPEKDVRLKVRNAETGEEIINIPFVDYALLVKGNYNRPMSDQEYLDRQDEYNMVFFLDDDLQWLNQYIYINSWRIVLQTDEL